MAELIESIPGYTVGQMAYDEYMGEKFNTKDPYYEELPNGEERRRKLPAYATEREQQLWKRIRNKAWTHDRCMCGMNCCDLGIGLAPIVSILPVIGPLTMYVLHGRILSLAEELRVPQTLHAKMSAQILFDFLITLIPLLGIFFSYMNQCSTRNAAMIFNYMNNQSEKIHAQGIQRVNEGYTRAADWSTPYQSQFQNSTDIQLQEQQPFIQSNEGPSSQSRWAPPSKPFPPVKLGKSKKMRPGQTSSQEIGVMRQ